MAGTLTISTLSDGTNSTSATNLVRGPCVAWANWVGSTGSIRASYNVSSVTRNATGNFTVNYTNALTDTNYVIAGMTGGATSNGYMKLAENTSTTMLTTSCVVRTVSNTGGSDVDQPYTLVSIIR
jgi:hypothetical protein